MKMAKTNDNIKRKSIKQNLKKKKDDKNNTIIKIYINWCSLSVNHKIFVAKGNCGIENVKIVV